MIFYDLKFIIPFIGVYIIYMFLGKKNQNKLLVFSSLYFYGLWDWRFLALLGAQVCTDYVVSLKISTEPLMSKKKKLLFISIIFNLGMLCYFKYMNFFLESFFTLFPSLGDGSRKIIQIVLPPAISFYTFESLSYVIDVYRGTAKVEKNFWTFSAFVAYFPKLVAGPIERAHTLLHNLNQERKVTKDKILSGLRLYVWGLFKKIVVADNVGALSDPIFADPGSHSALQLYFGAICFTLQIYGDFSGYTDMARGLSRMMGIELSQNFNLPYFSKSIGDFWRRWHITLGTWIKDYLFIPLGGSRVSIPRHVFNLMLTFFLSGLWHGASWNFVIWGLYYGVLLSAEAVIDRVFHETHYVKRFINSIPKFIKILITFHLIVLGWIMFRIQNVWDGFSYIKRLFSFSTTDAYAFLHKVYHTPVSQKLIFNFFSGINAEETKLFINIIYFSWFLIVVKLIKYYKQDLEYIHTTKNPYFNCIFYAAVMVGIVIFGDSNVKQFIYFQF